MTTTEPRCLATTLGSLPHTDIVHGTDLIFTHTPDIPAWVQFPKRTARENMIAQFTEGLPGIVFPAEGRAYFDTAAPGFLDEVTDFYERYLAAIEGGDAAALDSFGLSSEVAAGFGEFVARLPLKRPPFALKGQVTGPFTLGTSLLDQDRRCAYYDEQLRDIVVKSVALKALWQIGRLRPFCERVIIFADEPALARLRLADFPGRQPGGHPGRPERGGGLDPRGRGAGGGALRRKHRLVAADGVGAGHS